MTQHCMDDQCMTQHSMDHQCMTQHSMDHQCLTQHSMDHQYGIILVTHTQIKVFKSIYVSNKFEQLNLRLVKLSLGEARLKVNEGAVFLEYNPHM